MIRTYVAIIVLCALAVPATYGQPAPEAKAAQTGAATPVSALTEAEVRKVDKDASKITLKHGEIKNLDMPAMTMVFQVKDKAMLDKVKTGDKVRFAADKIGGAFTIMQIEAAK